MYLFVINRVEIDIDTRADFTAATMIVTVSTKIKIL